MFGEEIDERIFCVETERIVAEIYCVQVGTVEQGGEKGGQGRRDLFEEARSEDVM